MHWKQSYRYWFIFGFFHILAARNLLEKKNVVLPVVNEFEIVRGVAGAV